MLQATVCFPAAFELVMTVKADNIPGLIRKIRNSPKSTSKRIVPDLRKSYFFFKRSFDIILPSDSHRFAAMIPGHDYRNFVKPGITGLAQIKGLHRPKTDLKTIFWRYQWDAFYVRNAGFLLDLRILRQTFLFFFTQQMPICG